MKLFGGIEKLKLWDEFREKKNLKGSEFEEIEERKEYIRAGEKGRFELTCWDGRKGNDGREVFEDGWRTGL